MPISDNNPERRNLVITSAAFIIYSLGGGYIQDTGLKIQAISIGFDNPQILGYVAWVLILWFFLRYKQIYGEHLKVSVIKEAEQEKHNKFLIKYLTTKIGRPFQKRDGYLIKELLPSKGMWSAQVTHYTGGQPSGNGSIVRYKETKNEKINFHWAWFGIIRFSILLKIAIKKPGIGSWFVPEALFYLAIGLTVVDLIKC